MRPKARVLALISVLPSFARGKRGEMLDLYIDISLSGLSIPSALELVRSEKRLNLELDLKRLFGLHVHSCTHWLRPPQLPLPLCIWAHKRGRCWSAKIDISL
jgi:hypothetical protein